MPSTWYNLIIPPEKSLGCWKGTGCPLNIRTGSTKCLALWCTACANLFLIMLFESLLFWNSSAHSFRDELSFYKRKFTDNGLFHPHTELLMFALSDACCFSTYGQCLTKNHFLKKSLSLYSKHKPLGTQTNTCIPHSYFTIRTHTYFILLLKYHY